MAVRHFVVRVYGIWPPESFVVAESHAKAKAKVARYLMDSNYAHDFREALLRIKSCQLTKEPIGSVYADYHTIH